MPVSESEKLGVFVPGYHFSEKAEHIPIKKRRILFRASSLPRNTTNPLPEGAERHEASPKLNSNASSVSAAYEVVTGMCERGSKDHKLDTKELVKDDDPSGTSILASAACSKSLVAEADRCEGSGMVSSVSKTLEVPKTVEFNENNVKKEPDSHASAAPYKVDESTLNNSSSHVSLKLALSKMDQEPSIRKSSAVDVRFSWDLNTVMDAREEPYVSEHEISNDKATYVEQKKNNYTEANLESPSKKIINKNLSVKLNSLAPENKELKMEKCEPSLHEFDSGQHDVVVKTEPLIDNHTDSASDAVPVTRTLSLESPTPFLKGASLGGQRPSKSIINRNLPVEFNSLAYANKGLKMEKCEPLSHEFDGAQHVGVVKTEALQDKHTDRASDAIPVAKTLSLENPAHGNFPNCADLCGQSSGGFGSTQAVDTKLSIDCTIPPCFDHFLKSRTFKVNVGPGTQTVIANHKLPLKAASFVENGPHLSGVNSNKVEDEAIIASEHLVNKDETDKVGSKVVMEGPPAAISSTHDAAHSDADNRVGYHNSRSDDKAGSGMVKLGENSVGYDCQYEDGELREWTINDLKEIELTAGENEYGMNRENCLNLGFLDVRETNFQNGQEGSSGTIKLTEVYGKEADLTSSSVVLPGKLNSSDDVLSGSEPNETTSGQEKSETRDNVEQHASQSDWKMNVSGQDPLPESHRITSNSFNKTRSFTGRKFSYREEQKDKYDAEDVEVKAESLRFYRRESLTRIGGPPARDVFLSRDRYQMQGCSSKEGDGLSFRAERELGALRSFGRGRYSPDNRPSDWEGGMWGRSLDRGRDLKRLPSPSYQVDKSFHRSILEESGTMDNLKNHGGMDPSDVGRQNISSYVSCRPFRSRSPMTREVNDFRARLGLRPTGDMGHDRFVNLSRGRGRGRSMRYGTCLDGEGPRGRYHEPASDECDDLMSEYSHPFPGRRRCFSPIERRRGNNSYQHHQSDSISLSGPRTRSPIGSSGFRRRSRSPGFRPDARLQQPRSPGYRDHLSEYNLGPRNNSSSAPSSRWVNYKERPVFNRSPPPGRTDGPQVERFSFYGSLRKPKQNELYRSVHHGKLGDPCEGGRGRPRYLDDDSDQLNNGFRRGGFVRRYNMDGPAKRFQGDDKDRFSRGFDARDRHDLEVHARVPEPCSDGTDSGFRDLNSLQ